MAIIQGPDMSKINKIRGIVQAFADAIIKAQLDMGLWLDKQDMLNQLDEATVDNLLNQRRQLVQAVKEGMLEKKDQETLIGFLAALVWFNRQEEDRRYKIEHYG